MTRCVLTIEDDAAIRRGIVDALKFSGYDVLQAADGRSGLEMALHQSYDLLLLDLVLPGPSGLEILSAVRQARPTQPIIILSARSQEEDLVNGLRNGADDYVIKPFGAKELLARVAAVLRRSPARPSDLSTASVPGGTFDFERRELCFLDGRRAELSERESELLRYLTIHSGRAIDRQELLANVWGLSPDGLSTRTIDMHVARLREKLGDDPVAPRFLLTVRGKGYMVASPQGRESSS